MFDYVGDGGIGFQLSMYRLIDDLDQVGSIGRENALLTQTTRCVLTIIGCLRRLRRSS